MFRIQLDFASVLLHHLADRNTMCAQDAQGAYFTSCVNASQTRDAFPQENTSAIGSHWKEMNAAQAGWMCVLGAAKTHCRQWRKKEWIKCKKC